MWSVTISCCLIFVAFSICFIDVTFSFNMEELKHINYEVDISMTPVKSGETNYPTMHITSKTGQAFQCVLPRLNEEEISEKEVVNEKDTDVIDLLKPLKTGSCLYKSRDWWTYELCFGHYIKQFHIEEGQIFGHVITLGLYESDYDWNNETNKEKFKPTKQRYHSQYYTNGTKCDLTGQPRSTEVRMYCEKDAGDYIYQVDEPGTCSYTIIVHTSRLCSHSLLKPLASNKAHAISCHPVLNEEQYNKYLQRLKEEKELAEERRNQWLSNQQHRLQEMKNENASPVDARNIKVKILTAGYYDSEDGKGFQSLTDEETDQFRNMIMSVLSGQQEAVQEMRRHKTLEENYEFAWEEEEEEDSYNEED